MKSKIFLVLLTALIASSYANVVYAENQSTESPTATTTATSTKTTSPAKSTATTAKTTEAQSKEKTEVETESEVADSYTAYKAAKTSEKLAKAQAIGAKLIDQRINTLNKFTSKTFTGLTAAQVTALKTQVASYVASLTELKTKIAADTTIEMVKADIKTIYSDYNVYQALMPSLHLSSALNQGQAILDKLNALTVRLTATIEAKTAVGADTVVLTSALTDYKAQLADAATQLALVKVEIAKIDIKNAETSKVAVAAAREYMAKFKADIVAAKGDLVAFKTALSISGAASTSTSATSTSPSTTSATTPAKTSTTTSKATTYTPSTSN